MANSDLPSITVVGLMPEQARKVQEHFGDAFDLHFLKSETALGRVRSVSESSDHVILMTKFITHNMQDALRGHDGLIFCPGGVSSVDAILAKLYPEARQ